MSRRNWYIPQLPALGSLIYTTLKTLCYFWCIWFVFDNHSNLLYRKSPAACHNSLASGAPIFGFFISLSTKPLPSIIRLEVKLRLIVWFKPILLCLAPHVYSSITFANKKRPREETTHKLKGNTVPSNLYKFPVFPRLFWQRNRQFQIKFM